ncbi:MAG: hypothetical protein IPO21_14420 [Bacteroidales bacterium]|nr:hypothetical protein [Bacteroidales bacterium]
MSKIDVDYKKVLISDVAADGGLGTKWIEIEGTTRKGTASLMGSDASVTAHKNVLGDILASSTEKGDNNFNFQCGDISADNRAYLMGGEVVTDPVNGKKWKAPKTTSLIKKSVMIIGRDNSVEYAANVQLEAYIARADDDLAYIQVNGLVLVPEKANEEMQGSYDNIDSTKNDIVGFTLPEQTVAATINASAHTVAITVATGTSKTALAPVVTTSIGAVVSPLSTVATDFTSAVTYTVKSADGFSQVWTVTVTVAP